jgi:hypothetical protein
MDNRRVASELRRIARILMVDESPVRVSRSRRSSIRVAHRPYLYDVLAQPDGMGTWRVIRRWGALTDNGPAHGRVDGAKFDSRDVGLTEEQALAVAKKFQYAKTHKGGGKDYIDAFNGSDHVTPDGKRLKKGEYPVGLLREGPGFGWGTQSIVKDVPRLKDLQRVLESSMSDALEGDAGSLRMALQEAFDITSRIGDSSMAKKLRGFLLRPLNRIKRSGEILDSSLASQVAREVRTAIRYLDKQISRAI